jgi:tRNA uridine 5-carbamoylmethylation protein Kti12
MTQDIRQWIRELQAGHNIVRNSYPALARSTKSKARKKGKKLLRKYVWDAFDNQFDLNKIMSNNEKIFLGVSDFEDLVTVEIMKRRVDAKLSTVQRETTVLCDRQRWSKWAEAHYKDCLFVQNNSSTGFIIEEDTNNFIKFDVNSNSTTVRAFGDVEFAEDMIEIVESNFDVVSSYIEWVYGADGNSVNVPLNRDRLPTEEMYPFLNGESLGDYYDRYMESSANILLLIGPPGTGKTTFIRGLLAHRNCSAIVTYDAGILEKDGFFAKFIEDDAEVMVLEDSDAFLKSRSDGNTMMHRFLNVGDGLVTTKGKKMIFSTNLPSIRDIDSALIRPGRCFDIVTFDALNLEQANNLADKLGVKLPTRPRGKETKDYSIAEVFNQQSDNSTKSQANRKVGFI